VIARAATTRPTEAPAPARRRSLAPPAPVPAPVSIPAPAPAAASASSIAGIAGPQRIPDGTRQVLERSFGVDLGAVQVHTDQRAASAARELGARAVTVGSDIFLAAGERPTDLALMAHEVAHVVQQRQAPAVQLARGEGGDPFEREAQQAARSAASGLVARVAGRIPGPRIQRLGISDALDYFADKANIIPGFRMFTIILGLNPINMSRVERSAANILRALIEFMPGGYLITQALDNYGVFDRAGAFVERQVKAVGLSGAAIRKSIDDFLDSLSWRDIFHLGSVWDRAKRIVTDPIGRLLQLARNVVVGILNLVKDAILHPLARLAEGTRGYDLLKAVLGRDPITGDPYPRTAETLIGGFMKLIHQEEVWHNLQRAKAVPRAFAWFQRTIVGLLAFVRQIPGLFVAALRSLELADIIVLPRAFKKLVRVFGGFVMDFIRWAGHQVLTLLEIIFDVLAPAVMPYLRKAMGAFRQIIRNPVGFIRNLVRAGILGFRMFAANFLAHLRQSIIEWLTGSMAGANVYIPRAFELREILKFILSVLGLTWDNIRGKLVRAIGEPAVKALEGTFDLVVTLVREGPAAAWEKIRDAVGNLRDMVMEQVMMFVRDRIVTVAIQTLVTSLNPAGAFIQAVLAIYNTIMFLVERLRTIGRVLASFVDSIAAIAAGAVGSAAKRVETTMAGLLTLVISFLARLIRLGNVSDAVKRVIDRVRQPIDRALDRVVEWVVATARRLGRLLTGAPGARGAGAAGQMGRDGPPAASGRPATEHDRLIAAGLAAVDREERTAQHGGRVTREAADAIATRIRRDHRVFRSFDVVDGGSSWDFDYTASPKGRKKGDPKAATGAKRDDPIEIHWIKPAVAAYKPILLAPATAVAAALKRLGKRRLARSDVAAIVGHFIVRPTQSRSLDGRTIGATNPMSQTTNGFVFEARAKTTGNGEKNAFNALIERWGYNREDSLDGTTDGDHVLEKQLGGPDEFDNVWPLNSTINRRSGSHVRTEIRRILAETGLKNLAKRWLRLRF
jgi:Domain of unknown function (DUF4157)